MGTDLFPDDQVLSTVFPDIPSPASALVISILSQNWTVCTFHALRNIGAPSNISLDLVVRIELVGEKSNTQIEQMASIQALAVSTNSSIIPAATNSGVAEMKDGRSVNYIVTPFIDGVVLETIWGDMGADQQYSIMSEIFQFVKALQEATISKDAENCPPLISGCTIGSPLQRCFPNVEAFLQAVILRESPRSGLATRIISDENGIIYMPSTRIWSRSIYRKPISINSNERPCYATTISNPAISSCIKSKEIL